MENDFFKFITEPSKENFLASRAVVVNHEDYNPYADDIHELQELLDKEMYKEAGEFSTINLILSPRAHLYKRYAFEKLGQERDAEMEHILAVSIMEGIEMTGDGTLENPYIVTRIADERDLLMLLDEEFAGQALSHQNDKTYDIISTVSGKSIYFDITDCYARLGALHATGKYNK